MPNDHDTATDHRKRPRRRGEALHAAIFEATLAELSEVGYPALTMERIADRAQASKASLYRRWPGKVQLVMDAAYSVMPGPEAVPSTGSLRGDLLAMLREVAEDLAGPIGTAMFSLFAEAMQEPAQAEAIRAHSRGRSTRAVRVIVRRAHERGEVDADTITERQLETAQALMRHYVLTKGSPVPDDIVTSIVDEVLLPLFGHHTTVSTRSANPDESAAPPAP